MQKKCRALSGKGSDLFIWEFCSRKKKIKTLRAKIQWIKQWNHGSQGRRQNYCVIIWIGNYRKLFFKPWEKRNWGRKGQRKPQKGRERERVREKEGVLWSFETLFSLLSLLSFSLLPLSLSVFLSLPTICLCLSLSKLLQLGNSACVRISHTYLFVRKSKTSCPRSAWSAC